MGIRKGCRRRKMRACGMLGYLRKAAIAEGRRHRIRRGIIFEDSTTLEGKTIWGRSSQIIDTKR